MAPRSPRRAPEGVELTQRAYPLIAIGLGDGNSFSRLRVTPRMDLRAALSIWVAMWLWGHVGFWSAVLAGVIAVVVIAVLWSARANEFFRTN